MSPEDGRKELLLPNSLCKTRLEKEEEEWEKCLSFSLSFFFFFFICQDCWNDVSSKEEGVENGYVVFEVWPPSMAAGFRRKDPPKCQWRVLPWKLESDCFPAECWSKAAGVGAMIALSGHAGTRCSFFQVVGTSVQANTFRNEKNAKRKNSAKNVSKDKNKEKEIAKMNKKRKEEKKNESRNAKSTVNEVQTKKWFPTISQWSNQITDE